MRLLLGVGCGYKIDEEECILDALSKRYCCMYEKKHLVDYPQLMLDWDQTLNEGLSPTALSSGSHTKITWRCHKCGRVWCAPLNNRVNGTGCTCDAMERKSKKLRQRLIERDGSLAETRPEIAKQWHPTLNGTLTPNDITEHSMYKAWWIGEEGIPWQSVVSVRCRKPSGTNRPKSLAVKGFNDLKTIRPDLAIEWDYEKNTEIDIESVIPGSKIKVWWICRKGHEWQATVSSRNSGRGCPICNQERSTSFPEQAVFFYVKKVFSDAKNRYCFEKNIEVDIFIPSLSIGVEYDGGYYHSSNKKKAIDAKKNVLLKASGITLIRIVEDGCEAPDGTEYTIECTRVNRVAQIDMAIKNLFILLEKILHSSILVDIDTERDRTLIYEQYVLSEKQNSLATAAPNVLSEWHPTKNGRIVPEYVHAMSNKFFWWKCRKCGYEWKAPAYRRAKGMGCPVCSGNIIVAGFNDLPTVRPELMDEWDYERNEGIDPRNYSVGSGKKVWWKCKYCSYEWKAVISNRTRGNNCPRCSGKIITQEKSFVTKYPELASQWDYDQNKGLVPSDFFPGSEKKVWWKCEKGHNWKASIVSRTHGNKCPYCSNKKLLSGYNDFATIYPNLLSEWDYSKNTTKPDSILAGSNKKVFWLCKKGHSWQSAISNRIRGRGCPYCNRKVVDKGKTDLQTCNPMLALEWNQKRNKELLPSDVSPGSNRKVWWKCSRCGGEWEAIIWSRTKGRGCPYCAGVKPKIGINDLFTLRPDLASEWSYEKNRGIDPQDCMPGSRAKVWWKCNKCGHEWEATIGSRGQGRGCPACAGKCK